MPLEKKIALGEITVDDLGVVKVDMEIHVTENTNTVKQVMHSFEIAPANDYSDQPPEVQAVCLAAHTPEVIAAYQASLQ